jgi:hypothetical protein
MNRFGEDPDEALARKIGLRVIVIETPERALFRVQRRFVWLWWTVLTTSSYFEATEEANRRYLGKPRASPEQVWP